jgi:octaprenyl-diphosphate synthase
MVEDKTASLISAAARLGPILAGADREVVAAMGEYGRSLGRAFQIADDVLDFTGDADTLGKPVGLDLREGKITLPLIHALEAAPAAARTRLRQVLGRADKTDADWARIVAFVHRHGGVEAARRTARAHADRARGCLGVLAASPARDALEFAVQLVVDRSS